MGIEMYNKQVCQNPQQMEKKKLGNYYGKEGKKLQKFQYLENEKSFSMK